MQLSEISSHGAGRMGPQWGSPIKGMSARRYLGWLEHGLRDPGDMDTNPGNCYNI